MTMLELLCVTWMTALFGSSVTSIWIASMTALRLIQQQEIANDCADNTAELYFEGQAVPAFFVVNGQVCTVEVSPIGGQAGQQMGERVVARCGQCTQTLFLPGVEE